jgi:hypothetical protein
MLRSAFEQFCQSDEAAGRCADYSKYTHNDDVFQVADDGVGVWFIYEPALERPNLQVETEALISFGCWWRPDGVECHSGEHRY